MPRDANGNYVLPAGNPVISSIKGIFSVFDYVVSQRRWPFSPLTIIPSRNESSLKTILAVLRRPIAMSASRLEATFRQHGEDLFS